MTREDVIEWDETLDLLETEDDIVLTELTIGDFVTIKKELFDELILEVNRYRIENGITTEGVDLIMISEALECGV